MQKHFYLFRHGQTSYNVAGRIQGQTNHSVLTPLGVKQAFDVGVRLKDFPINLIVSSPLRRAMQTTKEVLKTIQAPVRTDNRFIEVNVGEIEGLHYTIVQEKFAEKYNHWRSLDDAYLDLCFEGGETKRQVRTRIFEALNAYAQDETFQHIGVSGHGILLTQVLLALGCPATDIGNGAILHLVFEDNHWTSRGFL